MLNFSELVERKDHKPYVRQYSTTGSQAVVIADLQYYEPTTVQRQVTEAVLSVHLSNVLVEAEIGGSKRALFPYTPGLFDLTPSHTDYSSERNDPGSAIALSLPSPVIAEVLGEIAPDFDQDFARLHDRPHGSDLVVALCRQILSEVADQSKMGPLYVDTLVQSLILELYRLSQDESSACIVDTKKISPAIMKLIDEYIDQNGTAVVEMRDLAAIAALPLASFSRLFKQTHGQSPYQYVLQRRIQKAYGLIDRSTLSLAQIAFQCGFSSQSHMTDVFRNKLGVTPGQIRRHLV